MFGLFQKKRIYLDYASATPVLPKAARAVARATDVLGNPGAIHAEGVRAKEILEDSRARIALALACKAREIVFVSGGTEANNLAILGFARRLEMNAPRSDLGVRGRTSDNLGRTHWVTSSIEHPSVLECFADIERRGGIVTHVEPDERGIIQPEAVSLALRPETVFVSIQGANHEIGTIQPLRDIKEVLAVHEANVKSSVIFHSDMGQLPLYRSPQVNGLRVDIASFDSGKLYGPRGVGCVYLNYRAELAPVVLGGGQERGLRAGTESVALAAGFAESFSHISKEQESEAGRVRALRDTLWSAIRKNIEGVVLNGNLKHSLPHILNLSIPSVGWRTSEYITLVLDNAGIAISTKSACKEGEERRSHVVYALGDARGALSSVKLVKEERAANTLRFSLGRDTSKYDIKLVIQCLTHALQKNANSHRNF